MLLLEASSQAALPPSFYQRPDVVQVARDLLGKGLFTRTPDGLLTGGLIVETEAYIKTALLRNSIHL
ncbi:MAG TPA: DNA-3-methyladenine glycosylase [Chlamydiales bacterium]